MNKRAVIHKINEYTYCIDDAGISCCYLVCGNKKAALIDTVNGLENLKDVVREITDLPLMVINTHGHCDHVYGNVFFEEAYIHPEDVAVHDAHFELRRNTPAHMAKIYGATEEEFKFFVNADACRLNPIKEGEIVDLGGVTLEVIRVEGHTHGSICLLDKASGNFFTGDAMNVGGFWMQLEESASFETYLNSLNALAPYRKYIKEIHGGHSVPAISPEFIDIMINGVKELLETKGEGDGTTEWQMGTAFCHVLSDGTNVLYTRDKL